MHRKKTHTVCLRFGAIIHGFRHPLGALECIPADKGGDTVSFWRQDRASN